MEQFSIDFFDNGKKGNFKMGDITFYFELKVQMLQKAFELLLEKKIDEIVLSAITSVLLQRLEMPWEKLTMLKITYSIDGMPDILLDPSFFEKAMTEMKSKKKS